MAELVIRKGEERDLEQMAVIEKLCFSDPWSRDVLSDDMLGNRLSTYVVAEYTPDGEGRTPEIVGYVGFWVVYDEGQINNVAVRPDMQRRHLGRMLLTTAMEAAKAAGVRIFTLEVRKSNEAALALYRSMGFKEDAVRPGYYSDGEDAVLMSCEVDG